MNKHHLIPIIFITAIALLILFLFNREYTEKQIDLGYSFEAKTNRFLALEHYLSAINVKYKKITRASSIYNKENQNKTLILLSGESARHNEDIEPLLNWVKAGGHLILPANEDDLTLAKLGITISRQKEKKATDQLTRLYLQNEQSPAYLSFDPVYHLNDSKNLAFAWANSSSNTHMLQMMLDKGMVTVLSDNDIWTNLQIEENDNAWLVWYLTQDSEVLLWRNHQKSPRKEVSPSLLVKALKHFPYTLLAAVVFLALLGWRLGTRLGPLLASPDKPRRQLAEHLTASSNFQLRYFNQSNVIIQLQNDILRLASTRHTGFKLLEPEQRWKVLSKLTRLPEQQIIQLMQPPTASNIKNYESYINQLQTLRNAL
ncbi:DUF4350 domain-containing protein [Pseudomonas sp. F1_0610]|uniref:DUF4350 domain-containing protein n=1 Tax=Pseudomonas sp. F1_0610 TaxID=3114284 RepID=UPI0039C25A2D